MQQYHAWGRQVVLDISAWLMQTFNIPPQMPQTLLVKYLNTVKHNLVLIAKKKKNNGGE